MGDKKNITETKIDWNKKYDVVLEQAVFKWIAGYILFYFA